jgi:Putative zinc ribbon domain
MKTCVSCGMPMRRPEDYPLGDESKDYCVHCARADGSMQSYEERAAGMASFIVETQGLDPGAALAAAKARMAALPAWRGRP